MRACEVSNETRIKGNESDPRIIISEATLEVAGSGFRTRFLAQVAVKGKSLPTRSYAVLQ